jgi:hypothetical protein
MSKSQLRKMACKYIKGQIGKFHGLSVHADYSPVIPLDELMLLKEGLADPSTELVASLKQLTQGSISEAEIDAHLVAPFVKI